jgi:hypothetical protein
LNKSHIYEKKASNNQTPRQSGNSSALRNSTTPTNAGNRKSATKDFVQENKRLSAQMNQRQQLIMQNRNQSALTSSQQNLLMSTGDSRIGTFDRDRSNSYLK